LKTIRAISLRRAIHRIDVSLDTLDAEKFRGITRWGSLDRVLPGIEAADAAGLSVKINVIALKRVNDDEFPRLIERAHGCGMDLTLIEVRSAKAVSTNICRSRSCTRAFATAINSTTLTIEPAAPRYVRVAKTGGRLGFITPLTHNYCESCNRVRLTCTGTLYYVPRLGGLRRPAQTAERLRSQRASQCRHR
jgi:GTP 3',8-cyclase